jgi:hypothetical protein
MKSQPKVKFMQHEDFESTAQEMSMHIALCVASEYVHSWGAVDFLEKLKDYVESQNEWFDLHNAIQFLKEKKQ